MQDRVGHRVQKQPELVGRRFLTGARIAAQPMLAFLDEQFGFATSAVDDNVKILRSGLFIGRHHIAHIHTLWPRDDACDHAPLFAPGTSRVEVVGVSDELFRLFVIVLATLVALFGFRDVFSEKPL